MRRTFKPHWLYTNDLYATNKRYLAGINLSCGHCAEQEAGIQPLQNILQISQFIKNGVPYVMSGYEKTNFWSVENRNIYQPIFGFDSRQIHYVSTQMHILKRKQFGTTCYYFMGIDENRYKFYNDKNVMPRELFPLQMLYNNQSSAELVSAWSSSEFGIMCTKEHLQNLIDLYIAFKKKDIVFCYGFIYNKLCYDGLIILIRSRLSKLMEHKQTEFDKINYELHIKTEDFGIKEKIQNILHKKNYNQDVNAIYADEEHKKILWFIDSFRSPKIWYSYEDLQEMEQINGSFINQ